MLNSSCDVVQVKENLAYETLPLRIKDKRTKHLKGKEISLLKVILGGAVGNFGTMGLTVCVRVSWVCPCGSVLGDLG